MYPELPQDQDLLRLIDEHLAKRSKSYVSDGHIFARIIKEKLLPEIAALNDNLGNVQRRCTALLQETRRLKRFRARVSKLRRGRRLMKVTRHAARPVELPDELKEEFEPFLRNRIKGNPEFRRLAKDTK
jgi:hypothetical protein